MTGVAVSDGARRAATASQPLKPCATLFVAQRAHPFMRDARSAGSACDDRATQQDGHSIANPSIVSLIRTAGFALPRRRGAATPPRARPMTAPSRGRQSTTARVRRRSAPRTADLPRRWQLEYQHAVHAATPAPSRAARTTRQNDSSAVRRGCRLDRQVPQVRDHRLGSIRRPLPAAAHESRRTPETRT